MPQISVICVFSCIRRSPIAKGYVQLRRGLFEHLEEGKIEVSEFIVLVMLIGYANSRSGIWHGNAQALETLLHGNLKREWILELLNKLAKKGYIKKFSQQGKRGWYPILVHNFDKLPCVFIVA